MWSILNGTIVNAVTVTVGSLAGVSISSKLPDRYRTIVLSTLGLITITLGIDAAVLKLADTVETFGNRFSADNAKTFGARIAMVVIASLIIGVLIGTALRLQDRIEALGAWIHGRFAGSNKEGAGRFADGFLTASVIFCVGPLTLLGCLRNGADADPSYLYIKSLLDGFCSMALASALGWGVLASVITIVVFQGGLSILAYFAAGSLEALSLALMTIVGGVLLLATALMILDIKKLPVADMLPAVLLPPLLVALVDLFAPGLLLPVAG